MWNYEIKYTKLYPVAVPRTHDFGFDGRVTSWAPSLTSLPLLMTEKIAPLMYALF